MSPRAALLPLLLAGLAPAALAADAFQQTQDQIKRVFQRHLAPPAPTLLPPDPFSELPLGADRRAAALANPDAAGDLPLEPTALEKFVADLRVNGIVQHSGRPHLVINGTLYSSGDLVKMSNDPPEYVRIVSINNLDVVFRHGDETVSVPVKARWTGESPAR